MLENKVLSLFGPVADKQAIDKQSRALAQCLFTKSPRNKAAIKCGKISARS